MEVAELAGELKRQHEEIVLPVAFIDMIYEVPKEGHLQIYEILLGHIPGLQFAIACSIHFQNWLIDELQIDNWKTANYLVLTNKWETFFLPVGRSSISIPSILRISSTSFL